MNRSTKSVVVWVSMITVSSAIVITGNYFIFIYVGMWNYIGLSILSGLVCTWLIQRSIKSDNSPL